jgi:glycosyltransferase involved in cell wall biosynthesis
MKAIVATSTAFHLRHLAVALGRTGWEVEFHSYLPRGKTRSYGLRDDQVVSHFRALLPWSALALVRGGSRWLRPVRERLFALIDRRIARAIGQAEVFVGLSAVTVASAARARELGCLVLIERGSSHILTQQATARASGGEEPSALYIERELASYAEADRIVVLSRFAAKTFADHGMPSDRLEVMPLGVDTVRFCAPAAQPPPPLRVLVAGVWSRRKGCDLIAPLLDQVPGMTITHAGLIGDLPLPRHPRFRGIGYQTHEGMAAAMAEHHLLVFPSRDDGFGMVMAEALACGLRVVASESSGGPDLAAMVGPPWVSLVPSGDGAALAAALRDQAEALESDPAGFAVPAEKISGLSWQAYGTRYAAMLQRLLRDRRQ